MTETVSTRLRRAVLTVALLNLTYFFVEFAVALGIGSVSLFADSVDFLEDAAVNLLIFLALGWSLRTRAITGKVLAVIILIPAIAAAWQLIAKAANPEAPDPLSLVITAGGAAIINLICSLILARFSKQGGSLVRAAFLTARNDVIINVLIILLGLVTALTMSGWPDIVLGVVIIALNFFAAREVWEKATEEHLESKALQGEVGCSCGDE
ncbi:cation transporter [Gulosibacter macacae]|uniref:Cation transporter n=1 Tax=Gulosibacter macacae TaxID=2488791 RepID=A0A3P3VUZ0_9MICO|nr:cation transporter [Gulosibacter macacae]RRJ86631.1 cation transporter [Gulosibacter macacae]